MRKLMNETKNGYQVEVFDIENDHGNIGAGEDDQFLVFVRNLKVPLSLGWMYFEDKHEAYYFARDMLNQIR